MKQIFCRVGSKNMTADKIIKYFPEHDTYTEPFFGSGSVFFLKDKKKREVINDLDTTLMRLYKIIQNIKISNLNIHNEIERLSQYNTLDKKNLYISDNTQNKNIDKIYKAILFYCNTFSSKGEGKIVKNNNQFRKLEKLNEYKERLDNVIIKNTDYKKILNKYDSPNTLHYLDPPYESSKKLYKNSYIDYNELEKIVRKLKGYVVISLNDSPTIRNIFKDYNIVKIDEKGYSRRINQNFTERTDILIMNYNV